MAGIADSDHEETVVLSESNSNNPQHISRSRPADNDSDLVPVLSSDPNSSWPNETVHFDHLSDSDLSAAVKRLTLTGVNIHKKELGQGGTGTVYEADYNGIPCATKRVQPIRERFPYTERNRYFLPECLLNRYFLQECLLHNTLRHENIVKMLGVSYDATDQSSSNPFLVMELMKYTLAQLINEMFIPMYVKLSILQDVSAGLCYLHSRDIVHCGIDPVNILLTADLVAKIGDFGDACTHENKVQSWGRQPWYNIKSTSHDVAYFGMMACNLITQSQPQSKVRKHRGVTAAMFGPLNLSDNTAYKISDGPLRKLVESCLNSERHSNLEWHFNLERHSLRPTISAVYETIIDIKKGSYV